jgi:hypothetical protein
VSAHKRDKRAERREHELDRMVAAATWRRERAKAGKGYTFRAPKGLRR